MPVFREPLGSGTTLDLSQSNCIELDILVEDPDSPNVDISLEEPLEDGYEFVLPPHILNHACGYAAGQFPKFADDVFHIAPDEGKAPEHFLLPTSETALINFHRGEILPEEELPKKYFAYTPCYRKEAGSSWEANHCRRSRTVAGPGSGP